MFDGNTDNSENKNETDKDKTVTELTTTVSYNPTESTTVTVTATIKTNKKGNKVDGWTLSDDERTLTKTYSSNITEELTLVDEDGLKKIVEVKVSNIINKLTEDTTVTQETKLPQTGVNLTIVIVIAITGVIAVVIYNKNKEYKGIK